MGPTIDVPDPLSGQMRVQLGRGDTRMTEQLLDDAQVGPAFQEMGRERMAQGVRADPPRQTGTLRRRCDRRPGLLPSESPAAIAHEQRATTNRRDMVSREELG